MLDTSTGDWGIGAPSVLSSGGSGSSATPNLGPGSSYFDIKINEVAPSEVSGMDANQIMDILHNLDVSGVTEAAEAHMHLASTLDSVAGNLASNAQTLAGSWQGTAAQAAMGKFQQMHTQTAQLAAQARQTGQVLHWTAGVMQQFKNLPTPVGESTTQADEQTGSSIGNAVGGAPGAAIGDGIGAIAGAFGIGGGNQQAKANAQAQKYLNALNQHLVAANNALPSQIGQAPSISGAGSGLGPAQMGGGGPSGASGVASGPGLSPYSGSGAGSGAGASGGPSHISRFNPSAMPSGNAGPKANLQSSMTLPSGPNTLPPPGSTPPPGPTGPGPSFVPTGGPIPNNGNSGPVNEEPAVDEGPLTDEGPLANNADALTGADSASADGLATESASEASGLGADSAVSADAAVGAEGAANGEIGAADSSAMGAEGEGMGFPMGGSGSGQQDKERQRQAWMNEDADIWGVPKDGIGSVIENNG